MSKKLLIIGAVIIAAFASLPLVGNMSVQKMTDTRIKMLEENGLSIKQSDNGSSYLTHRSHYEFRLEDPIAFKAYLDSLAKAQVPAYMSAMLDDVVMGADLTYSNMLFDSDISMDLYPIDFTHDAAQRMKREDVTLYEQMMKMLEERAFLYHMDYDVGSSSFKGYIKDINREITFQDGKKARIVFESATFNGKGTLVEPKSVDLHVKTADVNFILPEDASMTLSIKDLESRSSFSAKNSFKLDYEAKSLHFKFREQKTELVFNAAEMKTRSTSESIDGKLNTAIQAELEHFDMHDRNSSVVLEKFTFVADAIGIDEAAYEAFQKASEQAGNSSQYTMLAAIGVVAKGFILDIKTLSVEKLKLNDSTELDGFTHKIKVTVRADDNLIQKIQVSPLAMMQNFDLDAKLQFSEGFYDYIKAQGGNLAMVDHFAKREHNQVVFDILLVDGKITVNGASLQ